jgi:hypothetical protein
MHLFLRGHWTHFSHSLPLQAFDDEKAAQIKAAEDKDMCLRFVGVVNLKEKKAAVELREYPKTVCASRPLLLR